MSNEFTRDGSYFYYGETYRITPSRIFTTKPSEIGYKIDPEKRKKLTEIHNRLQDVPFTFVITSQ